MIHSSYHSLSISINAINIIMLIWLTFWYNYLFSIIFILLNGLLWVWLYIFNWLNDLYIESFFNITINEQLSLIYGIKLSIISELMLFVACFRCWVNFRFISNAFSLSFSFPLISCHSFSIPCSNLFILLLYYINGIFNLTYSTILYLLFTSYFNCYPSIVKSIFAASTIFLASFLIRSFIYNYLSYYYILHWYITYGHCSVFH
jgi:hypothetical protein